MFHCSTNSLSLAVGNSPVSTVTALAKYPLLLDTVYTRDEAFWHGAPGFSSNAHTGVAASTWKRPAGQSWHGRPVDPPHGTAAGRGKQGAVKPVAPQYVAAGHATGADKDDVGQKLPDAHGVGTVIPAVGVKYPIGAPMHAVLLLAPCTGLKVPGEHSTGADKPTSGQYPPAKHADPDDAPVFGQNWPTAHKSGRSAPTRPHTKPAGQGWAATEPGGQYMPPGQGVHAAPKNPAAHDAGDAVSFASTVTTKYN